MSSHSLRYPLVLGLVLALSATASAAPPGGGPRAAAAPLAPPTLVGGLPALPAERIHFDARETRRCLKCHGMSNFAVRDSATGGVRDLHVEADAFAASAHRGLACRDCHAEITEYPHVFATARVPVGCGADCHAVDRDGRPYRHAREDGEFASSVHAKGKAAGNPDSPRCTRCHGAGRPHAIESVKRQMTVAEKMALCAGCHDDAAAMRRNDVAVAAVASYRRSFHYKAIHFGVRGTAVCQDCHTVHHVLAARDTASSVAPAHLPRTCGQEHCHAGARMNFAMSGANHLGLRVQREPLLFVEERFFVVLTAGTLLALVGGIVLDVQRRLGWLALLRALGERLRDRLAPLAGLLRGALVLARRALIE